MKKIFLLLLLVLVCGCSFKNKKIEEYNDEDLLKIKISAQAWGADNLDLLPNENECKYITYGDLKEYGFIIDSDTIDKIPNNLKIKISYEESKYGISTINYEVDTKNINNCKPVYE